MADPLRMHLVRLLSWQDAHTSFEAAVGGLAPALRGIQPTGTPHSPWQLVEHLRLAQLDILEFCRNPSYEEPKWPDDYWPPTPEPPTPRAWDESVASFLRDRGELMGIAEDPTLDLFEAIPHGAGQTYLRELLLLADHNAYHIGQIVLVRRWLGAWPAA